MDSSATCPRCSRELTAPSAWSSEWECAEHGGVPPVKPHPAPTADWLRHVVNVARVPALLTWPLPAGWVISGVAPVGDEVTGVGAVATMLTGPSPLGGPAEMLVLSEEPGVGLGARLAGLPGVDPGPVFDGPPYSRLEVDERPVPLWLVRGSDHQAVVVGERDLVWVWVMVRPAAAGVLLVDDLSFTDARMLGEEIRLLPYGARSTWLEAG